MALKLDALCNDAVFYIDLAANFEKGDVAGGLGRLGLNTYPPILAALHHAGLSWETAGKWWGVVLASLAVLPLYGWVRRQFDERTALVAALLYAFHPKLIEWSPELLRDPTFWFFWALSLYVGWRAAEKTQFGWYAVAGLSIALAVHTRFEGWFLYLPLVGWSVCRREASRQWRKIATGVLLSVALCPLLVLFVNVTVLRDQPRWEHGNFDRLAYVALWWNAIWQVAGAEPGRPDVEIAEELDGQAMPRFEAPGHRLGSAPATSFHSAPMPANKMLGVYGNALRRGFGGLFGIAWWIGFAACRRRWLRADHAILFAVAACVAAAAWVHLWYAQATSSRYFLAIVLLACPCAAAGWLWTYDHLTRLLGRLSATSGSRAPVAIVAVLLTLTAGIGESLADRHDGRSREAALGRWLLDQLGPESHVATLTPMPLVGFYSEATTKVLTFGQATSNEQWASDQFDAIVAPRRGATSDSLENVSRSAGRHGYRIIHADQLPPGHDWSDILVLLAPLQRSASEVAKCARKQLP